MRSPLAALALVAALALGGCRSVETLPLGPEWAPLVRVAEDPWDLVPDGVLQTRGDTVYLKRLPMFVADTPDERRVHMTHERVHSARQGPMPGRLAWYAAYGLSSSFRWEEERRATAAELVELRDLGYGADLDYYADFLSGPVYAVLGFPMLTRDEALAWARATWAACERGERPER